MVESEQEEEDTEADDLTDMPRELPRPQGASNFPEYVTTVEINVPVEAEIASGHDAQVVQEPSDEPLQLIPATAKHQSTAEM